MMFRYLSAADVTIHNGDGEPLTMLSAFTYDPAARAYVLRAPRDSVHARIPRLVSPLAIVVLGVAFARLHFETDVRVPIEMALEGVLHEQEPGADRRRRPSKDFVVSEVAVLYGPRVEMLASAADQSTAP